MPKKPLTSSFALQIFASDICATFEKLLAFCTLCTSNDDVVVDVRVFSSAVNAFFLRSLILSQEGQNTEEGEIKGEPWKFDRENSLLQRSPFISTFFTFFSPHFTRKAHNFTAAFFFVALCYVCVVCLVSGCLFHPRVNFCQMEKWSECTRGEKLYKIWDSFSSSSPLYTSHAMVWMEKEEKRRKIVADLKFWSPIPSSSSSSSFVSFLTHSVSLYVCLSVCWLLFLMRMAPEALFNLSIASTHCMFPSAHEGSHPDDSLFFPRLDMLLLYVHMCVYDDRMVMCGGKGWVILISLIDK